MTPLATMVSRTLVRERLLALLSGFFALVGLVLTALGGYSVLSYAVILRTREIGIRVALGARAGGAVRSILTDTASPMLIGAATGLVIGLYASRFVESMLFEVTPFGAFSVALPLGTCAGGGAGRGRRSGLARGPRRSRHHTPQRLATPKFLVSP